MLVQRLLRHPGTQFGKQFAMAPRIEPGPGEFFARQAPFGEQCGRDAGHRRRLGQILKRRVPPSGERVLVKAGGERRVTALTGLAGPSRERAEFPQVERIAVMQAQPVAAVSRRQAVGGEQPPHLAEPGPERTRLAAGVPVPQQFAELAGGDRPVRLEHQHADRRAQQRLRDRYRLSAVGSHDQPAENMEFHGLSNWRGHANLPG
jgi:hypothetical protein